MRHCFASVLLVLAFITGCTTARGPQPALGPDGPEKSENKGLIKSFSLSHSASFSAQGDAAFAAKMLEDGFALTDANCRAYFRSAGKTQQNSNVIHDVVGAAGTFGSAVLALHDGSRHAAGYLALATGVTFSGIDIYTKNYLFSAENIDSVRTLVMNALAQHRAAALSLGAQTYASAALLIFGHQDICEPSFIAALARDAIKKGNVVALPSSSDFNAVGLVADQAAFQELGAVLNPPGQLTADQAGAFWWLLRDSTTKTERSVIYSKLSGLPLSSIPVDASGNYLPTWPHASTVLKALEKFSGQTKNGFSNAITAARASVAVPPTPAPAGAPTPAVLPVVPSPTFGAIRPIHAAPSGINVMIR